jgi:hypothetical protein
MDAAVFRSQIFHEYFTFYAMKMLSLFAALTLFRLFNSSAQVGFAGINYENAFERQAFLNLTTSKPEAEKAIALLSAVTPENGPETQEQAMREIAAFLAPYYKEEISEKRYKKVSKTIFHAAHKRWMRRYDIDAQFSDLFKTGAYNCATASALYAVLLESLKLPYAIVEMPEHINVIFDPEGENIVLEGTDPENGWYALDKRQMALNLAAMKLIPENALENKTPEQVFEEYFYKDAKRKINVYQLAGNLYYNKALQQFNTFRFAAAAAAIDKAVALNARALSEKTRLVILNSAAQMATDARPENLRPYFALLDHAPIEAGIQKELKQRFESIAIKYLIEQPSPAQYGAFHRYFLQQLAGRPDCARDIAFAHHFISAQSAALRFDTERSLLHSDSAYALNPGHLALQSFIVKTVQDKLSNLIFAPNEMNAELDLCDARFPFMRNNPKILQLRCVQTGTETARFFESNYAVEGLQALPVFERAVEALTEKDAHTEQVIGSVYSSISAYYLRQEDYHKAEAWLQQGLKYAPGSAELKRKQRALAEYRENEKIHPVRTVRINK